MPWWARNRKLCRICSSCFRLSAFSLACPTDSVFLTSRIVAGSVTSSLTASLWHSLSSCFRNFLVPRFPVGEAFTDEADVYLRFADLARLLGRHEEMAECKVPALKRITLLMQ
ncbi:hypothetical protein DPMN_193946 [Dreissena polymorpha]|uniref:Uncharacterized protein n=1 Tax=Dreissena polymorpha TaxID=45954 RepID=A0A9D4BEV2_DREPO|nr:hypothetical protein DPMN_193946 [Dreissena polymorpha]